MFTIIFILTSLILFVIEGLEVSSFGIRTDGGTYSGSGGATLTLKYEEEMYECSLVPKPSNGGSQAYKTYTCDGTDSYIGMACDSTDEILIENTAGGDALTLDRIIVTPTSGSATTISTSICLSTDGSGDGCPTTHSTVKVNIPSGSSKVYGSSLSGPCLVALGGSCNFGTDCQGYGSGATDTWCCQGICETKRPDWAGVGFCAYQCTGYNGGPAGSCQELGESCANNNYCLEGLCCNSVCAMGKEDWAGGCFCPDICTNPFGAAPGSCGGQPDCP